MRLFSLARRAAVTLQRHQRGVRARCALAARAAGARRVQRAFRRFRRNASHYRFLLKLHDSALRGEAAEMHKLLAAR